jgi:3-mercaptopyruvate sulfurtransferase SseA
MARAEVTVSELTASAGVAILDVRPIAAYNGWPVAGARRGGHIPGARPFPLSWFEALDQEQVLAALAEKGVTRERDIVVYGHDEEEAAAAADRLRTLGCRQVAMLVGGHPAWESDPEHPLGSLPRWRHLVHVEWLAALLTGGRAPELPAGRHVLAHVAFDNPRDYARGHIPGAIYLDTLAIEEPDFWNRRTPAEISSALCEHGITHDTTVVLYGRCGKPTMEQPDPGQEAGQIAAMRAAAILLYAGVADVRVLDGGIGAWTRSGRALVTEPTLPQPVASFGREVPVRPELIIDMEEAAAILTDPAGELVSIRSWAEFIGEVSGYHYVLPKGRIKGAVFGNCGSDAYHMQNYRNLDQTMRDYREIAERWGEVGVVPEKRIAFYCGTGWRASEAFFCAWLMGWDRACVYDGGWYEWSDHEQNPVASGVPAA